MPSIEVHSLNDLCNLRKKVRKQAQCTREELNKLNPDGMEAFYRIKFDDCGYHPLEDRRLDFIEQLNQTFTIIASLAAAEKLMKWFPNCGGLRLNLGASSGRDIESICPDVVEAEVFAVKNPKNNGKLKKDIERLTKSSAAKRYVFFFSPSCEAGPQPDLQVDSKVEIWALEVWPESGLAGFRATSISRITGVTGIIIYVIRFNNLLLHRYSMSRKQQLEENRGFRPDF